MPFLLLFAVVLLTGCIQETVQNNFPADNAASSSPGVSIDGSWSIEDVVTGLDTPWDIAIGGDGTLYVTERHGTLRVFSSEGDELSATEVKNVVEVSESGLTGIALHPDFDENRLLYLAYTYDGPSGFRNRVSRYVFRDATLSDEKIIVDDLPGGSIHNGGRLRFGPDGNLWILTGDGGSQETAQDPNSLGGKVLRVEDDGAIPSDNPFPNSSVYSLGHRNPQGLDWHPDSRQLYVSEHGSSAHDEVNIVLPGKNYGWPRVRQCVSDGEYEDPIICSSSVTWAPSGLAFLRGPTPFSDSLFLVGLRGSFLKRFSADGTFQETIIDSIGRLRGLTAAPDGSLLVTTSNRDGRGLPGLSDDRILRLRWVSEP